MQFTDSLKKWAGWCPMEAAAKAGNTGNSPSRTGTGDPEAGPVIRREILFFRMAWIVIGLSYILAIAVLPILPEVIPIHWNYAGVADGFAGKIPGVFGFPVIMTLLVVLARILPRYERKSSSFSRSRDIYAIVIFSATCIMLAMEAITFASAAGMMVPLQMVMPMILGVIFIVIGSLLPFIGQNRLMGIRLPWTLADKRNWKLTHERGGPVFMGAGIIVILGSPFAGIWAIVLMLAVVCVAVVYIAYYSYRLSKAGTNERGEL